MTHRFSLRAALLAGAASLGFAPAGHAQSATQPETFLQSLATRKNLLGDWGGLRPQLAQDGLTFNLSYVGEFADVMSGGVRGGNGYAQQLNLGAALDLGKLVGLQGGSLHIVVTQREGRSVSADELGGNKLAVQEVYGGGNTMRLTEFDYVQKFADDRVETKIGFFPMGNDFASTAVLGCQFQNLAFCAHAQNLPSSSGWSDYPTGKWGGDVKFYFTPDLYLQTGVFDVNFGYYQRKNGLKISLDGSSGAIVPVELDYTAHPGGLVGHYKVGVYWDSSSAADVTNANEEDDGRYGYYAIADQMLVSFGNDPKRGLIALGEISYSDPRTSTLQGTILGGLIAQGPFDVRPHDYINLGYARAVLNGRIVNEKQAAGLTNVSNGESVLEFGYGVQATPWLMLHPNFQYVMDPGTFSYKHIPNTWVFGVQLKATL